jgi:hypothetical protein
MSKTALPRRQNVAVKILPFGTDPEEDHGVVNGTDQMSTHDVVQEVIVTRSLSGFGGCSASSSSSADNDHMKRGTLNGKNWVDAGSNYVELVNVHVVHGPYPEFLLEAWDRYDEEKDSENDRPGTTTLFL